MTSYRINNEYFDWMCDLVCGERRARKDIYNKLLTRLHETTFNYIIPMDVNRLEDGINLRYRFGREKNYDQAMIGAYLDNMPCSILEMMVALAVRCEEDIMCDPDLGDRTDIWFWDMVRSLGLIDMNNVNYYSFHVDEVLERFIRRGYKRNGQGGLFTVTDTQKDMRSIEIWYQMCMYLDEKLARKDI